MERSCESVLYLRPCNVLEIRPLTLCAALPDTTMLTIAGLAGRR